MEENTETKNNIIKRPPIICIMGHIDHGKSTLLDYIRKTNIVDTEAGGITQRISAYEIIHKMPQGTEERITFLDTPGHEAFNFMRACGTKIADIAILIVSAEEGVKNQTLEALKCIIDSKIPYIVAISKIDKPGANIEKTKNSLIENGIYIEGYGGTIPFVPISSKTGQGISELLDMILLIAEIENFKGDTKKLAEGLIIEAHLDKQKGITAVLIIKDGYMGNGMYIVSGDRIAPTRMMENFLGKKITEAIFSSPVRIIGFDKLPKVGEFFITFDNKKDVEKYILENKTEIEKNKNYLIKNYSVNNSTDDFETDVIRIMIKTEAAGSIHAVEHEIDKINSNTSDKLSTETLEKNKIKIKIIGTGIGNISENNVKLASGNNPAIILGFDVGIDSSAKDLAERTGIEIKKFDIIYKITEYLNEEILKRTPKIIVEEITAEIKVLKNFSAIKDKYILGARVEKGTVFIGEDAKIIRKNIEIGRGKIRDLEKDKNKVSEIREGVEFGCQFVSEIPPAPGDKLLLFKTMEK
ncbi:MAG: translation initiation factor IF-2 [bacterium]